MIFLLEGQIGSLAPWDFVSKLVMFELLLALLADDLLVCRVMVAVLFLVAVQLDPMD